MAVTLIQVGQPGSTYPEDGATGIVQYPAAINYYIIIETTDFNELTVSKTESTLTHGGTVYQRSFPFSIFFSRQSLGGNQYAFRITSYTADAIVQVDGTTYSWSMQLKNSGGGTLYNSPTFSYTVAGGVPNKATSPVPTDTATGVSADLSQLSWSDGGGADTYDVYFGPTGGMSLVSSAQAGTTWSIPSESLLYNTGYQWRIDATNAEGTTAGDTWSFTTAALTAVNLTAPADETTDYYLNSDWLAEFTWTSSLDIDKHTVWFGLTGALVEQTDRTRYSIIAQKWFNGTTLDYATEYQWKVVTVDRGDTIETGLWTLTTIAFTPPVPSGGAGGEHGGEGGKNNMVTVKRLVAAANNTVFYEDE